MAGRGLDPNALNAEPLKADVAALAKRWTKSERAAIMYTLIQTAKLNDIDPQAWLADTLSKIADTPQTRLGKLLPWNWMSDRRSRAAA